MQLLQKNNYNLIPEMFSSISGCDVSISSLRLGEEGAVYVDSKENPTSSLVETHYGFYCFGGKYNEVFLDTALRHVISITKAKGTQDVYDTYVFIFFNDDEWKSSLVNELEGYNCKLIKRNYYHLDEKLFLSMADKYKKCPPGYSVKFTCHEEPVFKIEYNGKSIGSCKKGSKGEYADIDVFIDEKHRRKGLALSLISQFILYCLKNGLEPRYGCWDMNKPSANLAQKLGFHQVSQMEVVWCVIN